MTELQQCLFFPCLHSEESVLQTPGLQVLHRVWTLQHWRCCNQSNVATTQLSQSTVNTKQECAPRRTRLLWRGQASRARRWGSTAANRFGSTCNTRQRFGRTWRQQGLFRPAGVGCGAAGKRRFWRGRFKTSKPHFRHRGRLFVCSAQDPTCPCCKTLEGATGDVAAIFAARRDPALSSLDPRSPCLAGTVEN